MLTLQVIVPSSHAYDTQLRAILLMLVISVAQEREANVSPAECPAGTVQLCCVLEPAKSTLPVEEDSLMDPQLSVPMST